MPSRVGAPVNIAGAAPLFPSYGQPVQLVDPNTGNALTPLTAPSTSFPANTGLTLDATSGFTTVMQNGGSLTVGKTSTSTTSGGVFGSTGLIANGDYALGVLVEYNPPSSSSNLLFGILSQVNVNGSAPNSGFLDNAWHGFNYNSTGNFASGGIWVGEFSGANMNSATVLSITACEFNIQNGCDATFKSPGGSGTVTNGYAVRVVIAPYGSATTGFVNAYGFYVEGSDAINDAQAITNRWGGIIKAQNNTPTGISTTGGFISRGWEIRASTQSGNTSGTNESTGIYIPSGGGAPGAGGTAQNRAIWIAYAGGDGTAPGATANNWGIFIDRMQVAAGFVAGIQIKRQGSAGSALAGSANYGIHIEQPVAGGNASGTVTNYGIYSAQAGTSGTSSAGGTVTNYSILSDLPTGGGNTAGTVNNYGLRIQGNGGTPGSGGTVNNWAIISTSPANSAFLGSLSVGSTTPAIGTGALAIEGIIPRYNAIATAGWGVPAIYAAGRPAQQVNSTVTLASYVVGAADGSFEISANLNVTVSTTVAMTVTCTYTDEANVARTLTLQFSLLGGTWASSITSAQGNIPYESPVYHIRAKAATTISIQTAGTVTAVTYTGEAIIKQMR